MDLIQFYQNESEEPDFIPAVLVVTASIAQGLLLAVIIQASSLVAPGNLNFQYLLKYIFLFFIFMYGKTYALKKTSEIISDLMEKVKLRISDKIRKSSLLDIERMGNERIYAQLTNDTGQITESALMIMNSFQSCIMVCICAIYILFISQLAFLISVVSFVFVFVLYIFVFRKSYDEELDKTFQKDLSTMEMLNEILYGFKELKINQAMSDEHFQHYQEVLKETRELKTKTGYKYVTHIMFSQVFYYTFFAIILFVLPAVSSATANDVIKVIATGMFVMSPFNMFVGTIPLYIKSSKAIDNIYRLEKELDSHIKTGPTATELGLKKITSFKTIELKDLNFSHRDTNGTALFTVGPIHLTIHSGELIFIAGGNGSGKTTLMKLLCGLYEPDSGTIFLDQNSLEDATYPLYCDLFSVIMSDFYLFDRLYGIEKPDQPLIKMLLKKMKLNHKTDVVDSCFTNIHLSTGQRKRLALVTAILQDKPIYIFDEWAADQDMEFRTFYYETLLKELKNAGKTVIAVSHDDRYYHVADRIIKMDYGQFVS
jgi:putative ATP-binding cassette transporter